MTESDEPKSHVDANSDPSLDELRLHARKFHDLATRFRELSDSQLDVKTRALQLRSEMCLGCGVQAGAILGLCLDRNAFSSFACQAEAPEWDLRGRDRESSDIQAMLAGLAFDGEELPLVVVSVNDPNFWEIARPADHARWLPEDDGEASSVDGIALLEEALGKPVDEDQQRERTQNTVLLSTWFAAIRWWISPEFGGFRGDLWDGFHPWIESLRSPYVRGFDKGPALPPVASDPNVPVDKAALFLLEAHAEIQSHACEVLAEILENEAVQYENGQRISIRQRISDVYEAFVTAISALDALFEYVARLPSDSNEQRRQELYADLNQRLSRLNMELGPQLECSASLCKRQVDHAVRETGSMAVKPLLVRFYRCASEIHSWGFARLEDRRETEYASYAKRALDETHDHFKPLLAHLSDAVQFESGAPKNEGGEVSVKTNGPDLESSTPSEAAFPNPSAPMSKKDAAAFWGGSMTVNKLTNLMGSTVRFHKINRQTFVFCRDDVPNLPEK